MAELNLPTAVVIAGALVAAALVYLAHVLAHALSRQPTGDWANQLLMGPQELPLSTAGFPLEPSGIPVRSDTALHVGSTVLASSQGRWWRAEVVALEAGGRVRIRYPGWDPKWDESVPRSELQVDLGTSASDEKSY